MTKIEWTFESGSRNMDGETSLISDAAGVGERTVAWQVVRDRDNSVVVGLIGYIAPRPRCASARRCPPDVPVYGSRGKKGPPGRAFLTDARRHCLDADLAREYEVDGVDNSNRSMSLGEGAGSSPEALLEAEITRGQVILVPSRVQAPT
jgi:hypothetical protein